MSADFSIKTVKNGILKTIGIKVEYTTNWKLRQRFQRNSADFSSKPSYLRSSQLRTALCPYNASYLGLALIKYIRMKIFVSPAQLAHSVSSAGPEKQSSRLTTIKGFFKPPTITITGLRGYGFQTTKLETPFYESGRNLSRPEPNVSSACQVVVRKIKTEMLKKCHFVLDQHSSNKLISLIKWNNRSHSYTNYIELQPGFQSDR
jgi:hypothetical protein